LKKQKTKTDLLLQSAKKIHMIGIGGSGMYPIAEIFHAQGYTLTGSDNNETDTLKKVRELGIPVVLGHFSDNVNGADAVIYSAAIQKDNPELVSAEKQGIPTIERSFALGFLTRNYSNVIGVCGTHGKTTVSSMITQILLTAKIDAGAVIGGRLPLIDGNGRAGDSGIMICEACEYVDTFLKLSPDTVVILNIDEDHMEYFKTLENLISSFTKFAGMAKQIIVNADDENSLKAVENFDNIIYYSTKNKKADYNARNIEYRSKNAGEFDLYKKDDYICRIHVTVPGEHNISNALCAAAAALNADAGKNAVITALREFKGAGRRFEILGQINGATVADDYAHHPKEIEVTLNAAKKMGYNRVIAVFQPFTYSRTKLHLDEFARVLSIADTAVITEIMGSREINTGDIHAKDLCEKTDNSIYCETFEDIEKYVKNNAKENDLIITLGCGDIYKTAKMILEQ